MFWAQVYKYLKVDPEAGMTVMPSLFSAAGSPIVLQSSFPLLNREFTKTP